MTLTVPPGVIQLLQVGLWRLPPDGNGFEYPEQRLAQIQGSSIQTLRLGRTVCRMLQESPRFRGTQHSGVAAPEHEIARIAQVLMTSGAAVSVEGIREIQREIACDQAVARGLTRFAGHDPHPCPKLVLTPQ